MTSEVWDARYPDLAGKVALVTGAGATVVAIATVLAANGVPIALISPERETVDAVEGALGFVGEPSDPDTLQRVLPHVEQRLGPLDVVVAAGEPAVRAVVMSAVRTDMVARRRGVIIEVGADGASPAPAAGVRHRVVVADADADPEVVAAAVAFCASDVITAPDFAVRFAT